MASSRADWSGLGSQGWAHIYSTLARIRRNVGVAAAADDAAVKREFSRGVVGSAGIALVGRQRRLGRLQPLDAQHTQ